jgi:hypothetical protein
MMAFSATSVPQKAMRWHRALHHRKLCVGCTKNKEMETSAGSGKYAYHIVKGERATLFNTGGCIELP